MNHVGAAILEGVARLYPEMFKTLVEYYTNHANFQDEIIITFDREIQFYISYISYISKIKKVGLKFCYPAISDTNKNIYNYEGFDIALAYKLVKENTSIVCNDFYLEKKERIFIVSGPNQGGKTTFARTFGQLHYLAALGCPVPGRKSKLFLFDKLFTHFEKEETIENLRSKLEDDLVRIHNILLQATSDSVIIMNEILSSTTLQDSIFLSKKIMEEINRLDILCVWVTFIDELLLLSDKTVSMVSMVVPESPAIRTFKIERRAADGLAYALSIAKKFQVTYDSLKKRIRS
jgi:DNA mismatch repair protein MutS